MKLREQLNEPKGAISGWFEALKSPVYRRCEQCSKILATSRTSVRRGDFHGNAGEE